MTDSTEERRHDGRIKEDPLIPHWLKAGYINTFSEHIPVYWNQQI